MKKITYKERAMFYAQEVKKNHKNVKLLNTIRNKYNINYAVVNVNTSMYKNGNLSMYKNGNENAHLF